MSAPTHTLTMVRRRWTDGGDFAIWTVTTADGTEGSAKGALAALEPDDVIKASGKVGEYKGEWQIAVSDWTPSAEGTGIGFLLAEAPGVGPATAAKIVGALGEDVAVELVGQAPAIVLMQVGPFCKPAQAAAIAHMLAKTTPQDKLAAQLAGRGLSLTMARKVVEKLGQDALEAVEDDPYILTRVHGIGFKLADQVALARGMAPADPRRARAVCVYLLMEHIDKGSCWMERASLEGVALGLLREEAGDEAGAAIIVAAIDALIEQGEVVQEGAILTTRLMHRAEREIARHLQRIVTAPLRRADIAGAREALAAWQRSAPYRLTEQQAQAPWMVIDGPGGTITGGAGTGKTTTLQAVLATCKGAGLDVVLMSPTGKAAHRMGEVTKSQASTIHRALEFSPICGGFTRDEGNPLCGHVFVIDEVSMLDVDLLHSLLRAIPNGGRILFIGDVNQLQSVGPGAVLADIIASGILPVIRLEVVQRAALDSAITRSGYRILQGDWPDLTAENRVDASPGSVCWLDSVGRDGRDDPGRVAKWALTRMREHGHDPAQVQILSAMHRGDAGTQRLNEEMQAWANPDGLPTFYGMRVGDRVIQTSNNYNLGVFNGDCGILVEAGERKPTEAEKRKRRRGKEEGVPYAVVDFQDGRVVEYDAKAAEGLQLAYCITVHKAQGSEAPVIIGMVHTSHFMMLSRSILYTLATRAKSTLILIGSKRALHLALKDAASKPRLTRLAARIGEVVEGLKGAA